MPERLQDQLVARTDDRIRDLDAYGYKQGTFLANSGYVRVEVSPGEAVLEYVRSSATRAVADKCEIPTR